MANPYHHSLSSVKRWGGEVDDYLPLHEWLDGSKEHYADFRHRALRHHSEGIYMLATIFGKTIKLSTGRTIPTRWVGEQHVKEDLGFIPSVKDWLQHIKPQRWMGSPPVNLEKELEKDTKVKERPVLGKSRKKGNRRTPARTSR